MKPYTDADVDLAARAIAEAEVTPLFIPDGVDLNEAWNAHSARAVLDALAAAGRLPAPHLLPLLALTADEIDALRVAALSSALDHGSEETLRSALDKLTTTEETPDA